MYEVRIKVPSYDVVQVGDWCTENIDRWSFSFYNEGYRDALLPKNSVFVVESDTWYGRRWIFLGLSPRNKLRKVSVKFFNGIDAMAFKLRWL